MLKLLAGIILAGCLGALGLSPVALAAESSSRRGPLTPVATAPSRLLQANVPAGPGEPAGSGGLVIDCDRESEPDDEAHLILIGGLDRDGNPFPHWFNTSTSPQQPGLAPPQVRLPRCFPIRC